MIARGRTALALTLHAPVPLAGQGRRPWSAPKTSWGAPDRQGVWTSDDARSVPMQRPPQSGDRRPVTDPTNFSDQTVIANNQTSELLVVTGRLTGAGSETIADEATIDDPGTWTVTVPLSTQSVHQAFPYECHQGHFALRNILNAARAEERAIAQARIKGIAPPAPSDWQGCNTGFLPADPSFGRPR
jgi:hypothetical protein